MKAGFEPVSRLGAFADPGELLANIPFARFLRIEGGCDDAGVHCVMRFHDELIGNPRLPALHGGVIGAFLETVALVTLVWETGTQYLPKTIDLTVEYLRSGRPRDTFARAALTKHGRRVANVRVEAWQEDRSRPIAAAHGHFLLRPPQS